MAFVKKTWKDRIAEFPTRRRLTKEDNTSELVTVAREEGTLSQEGDAFSAENMNDLENRIDAEFTEVNGKLESLPGRLIRIKSISADGTAGTYSTDIELNSNDVYFVIERPTNADDSLMINPIINGYFNPTYINIVNGKIAIIFSGQWGFAHIYKLV